MVKRTKPFKPKNISKSKGKDKKMVYKKPQGISDKYYKENRR